MGKRGPRAFKKNLHTPRPTGVFPKPLPKMRTEAKRVWNRIVKALPPGYIGPEKFDLLRGFCEASASYERATVAIKEEGEVIKQENGIVKANPWVTVAVQMASIMASASVKLGINYTSTSKMQVEVKPVSKRPPDLLFGGKKPQK